MDKFNNLCKIPCPCCGKSLVSEYDICPVCNWENDPIQEANPDTVRGANWLTLTEARARWRASSRKEGQQREER
ncbi:MAG TPA: hypothetical protein H9945_04965 [Candidatus Gemmiger avicola]|uniref:Cysteine-rich CPCC domain-containing protein n=1 Tax=Candidatus Gemmiger avicola TaxID=2838605 RepID=A0A9D2M5I8_9FIRM|nr:hypothetical protein [Candidatus Gemmiger avicola]